MKVEYFSLSELSGLAQHSQSIGWYSEADWNLFLRTGVVLGHRLQSGEIVSSAYFSNFENKAGSLGAFIVNPRFQGKKLGKALIEKVVSLIPNQDFVLSLIATQRGKRMYEQAGFVEIGNTHKFVLENSQLENSIHPLMREYRDADFETLLALDTAATGYSRKKLFQERLASAEKIFVLQNTNDEVSGFIAISRDGNQNLLGPVIAPTAQEAYDLILSCLRPRQSYRIDILHWQKDLIQLITNSEFELERICPMMTFKGRPLMATADQYFAVMSQALG